MRRPGDAETEYLTACDTPLGEGWQVLTRTAEVQEMRRLQMEMTMADHHQDCSTCPRNGNCELLSVANSVGLKEIRFRYPEGWKDLEPDHGTQPVVYDRSRCIRCQRCVAVCRKVQGVDALEMTGWGRTAGIRPFPGSGGCPASRATPVEFATIESIVYWPTTKGSSTSWAGE